MNSQLQILPPVAKAFSLRNLKDTELLSLRSLEDAHLLSLTKSLVQKERELTTQVLRHLQEIERRKLYCDLKYGSLFDYAVGELKYSEAAAARRIQAMRLMTEIPEVESKIESGVLNLSNICQAQSFFKEQKKAEPEQAFSKLQKQEILEKLEQKSAREGQRILLEIGGDQILPKERERIVSPEHSEIRFVADQELKNKLEEVRSLLGARGAQMNFAELVTEMACLSCERLSEKKFGKKRALAQIMEIPADQAIRSDVGAAVQNQIHSATPGPAHSASLGASHSAALGPSDSASLGASHSASLGASHSDVGVVIQAPAPRTRYISQAVKHQIWQKAQGKCNYCGSKANLQIDHIQPFALGGASRLENLQLLCRACNLRRGVQIFGDRAMHRA